MTLLCWGMARRWIFGYITWSAWDPDSSIWKGIQQRLSRANKFSVWSLPAAYKNHKPACAGKWAKAAWWTVLLKLTGQLVMRVSEHLHNPVLKQSIWASTDTPLHAKLLTSLPFNLILHNSTDFGECKLLHDLEDEREERLCARRNMEVDIFFIKNLFLE